MKESVTWSAGTCVSGWMILQKGGNGMNKQDLEDFIGAVMVIMLAPAMLVLVEIIKAFI